MPVIPRSPKGDEESASLVPLAPADADELGGADSSACGLGVTERCEEPRRRGICLPRPAWPRGCGRFGVQKIATSACGLLAMTGEAAAARPWAWG
jgi:hypothetical protein